MVDEYRFFSLNLGFLIVCQICRTNLPLSRKIRVFLPFLTVKISKYFCRLNLINGTIMSRFWKKEKILETSIPSFSHNILYFLKTISIFELKLSLRLRLTHLNFVIFVSVNPLKNAVL